MKKTPPTLLRGIKYLTYDPVPLHQRDEAFAIRPYPFTGLGVWLCPALYFSPAYTEILSRLKSGSTIIDIGSFLGMDLRRLVYDGAPSDKMYAVDMTPQF